MRVGICSGATKILIDYFFYFLLPNKFGTIKLKKKTYKSEIFILNCQKYL